MNVLGHTYVAMATGRSDPEFLLGAALPDLAPMAGVRVARHLLGGPLGAGVRCHVQADEAFHAHERFRSGAGELRRALTGRGIASGPARAVGHAGWELMLDGTLVRSAVEEGFRRALAAGEGAVVALPPEDRPRWLAFLDRARRPARLRYDDPSWVADRLHAALAHRPRLRLRADEVATVADVLEAHVDGVVSAAPSVLADTVDELVERVVRDDGVR